MTEAVRPVATVVGTVVGVGPVIVRTERAFVQGEAGSVAVAVGAAGLEAAFETQMAVDDAAVPEKNGASVVPIDLGVTVKWVDAGDDTAVLEPLPPPLPLPLPLRVVLEVVEAQVGHAWDVNAGGRASLEYDQGMEAGAVTVAEEGSHAM